MRSDDEIRIDLMLERIDLGQTVVDVGAVRHDEARRAKADLHTRLTERSPMVVGVDIVDEEVEKMRDAGFDVRVGDAEALSDLDIQPVDVVVAGELIEHLSNPGDFLESADAITKPEGTLVLSTPNPHAFVFTKKAILGRPNNEEHTCWFDPQFLGQLARRHGWTVRDVQYVLPSRGLSRLIYMLSPVFGSPNFVAVLEKTVRE